MRHAHRRDAASTTRSRGDLRLGAVVAQAERRKTRTSAKCEVLSSKLWNLTMCLNFELRTSNLALLLAMALHGDPFLDPADQSRQHLSGPELDCPTHSFASQGLH